MKGPKDGRVRPVYIIKDNKRALAISDGKGSCYLSNYGLYEAVEKMETIINTVKPLPPHLYEFDRGLSGFDF